MNVAISYFIKLEYFKMMKEQFCTKSSSLTSEVNMQQKQQQ